MSARPDFSTPDELDLLLFFGSQPAEKSEADGYWCFEASDARGVRVRFSFNLYERSVQTVLTLAGEPVSVVSHEGATRLSIEGGTLRVEFAGDNWRGSLLVTLGDALRVEWSTLRTS